MHQVEPGPHSNRLLAALPRKDFELLLPHLAILQIEQATVICEACTEFDHVYFPLSGMISLVIVMRDGKAIETATVGREGVVGAMSGLGLHVSQVRAIAQLPMFAARIAPAQLRKAASSSKPISDLCLHYNEVLLAQARVTAACNALHHVEARFCRWLLQTRDRAESDTIMLTQEFLSEMLGVRRTSVSLVANTLQTAGLIRYRRGHIRLLNIEGLRESACECYATIKAHGERLLDPRSQG